MDFRLPLTLDNILLSAIELAILENMVGAIGILILYHVYKLRYMHFRFNGSHIGFPTSVYVGQYIEINSSELLDLENMGVAVEIPLPS